MSDGQRYEVTADDDLYRRLIARNVEPIGEVNSSAFDRRPDEAGLSVSIAALTTTEAVMVGHERFGLAVLSAEAPIDLGLAVVADEPPNPSGHAEIRGQLTQSMRRKLAKAAKVLKQPEKRSTP